MEERKGVKIPGAYLREIREKKGLSVRQVAEKLGISPSHLSNIERDLRGIGGPLLLKMAEFYGLPVQDFVEEDKPPERTVDLIAELYKADFVVFDGELIDVRDDGVAWRIETAIRMGLTWAKALEREKGKKELEQLRKERRRRTDG
ncbi:MAG TPA: helix-turn-helix transcriptional regulator [Alicyclobacillus sp.]|nr:helix-turn-helix transcriptional regulator [Alicyclobacillus sp.]